MRNLLMLFIRNGGFVTFLFVEVFCFYLIVNFNSRQNSILSYTSSTIGGYMNKRRQNAFQYLNLSERADSISAENARLKTEIYKLRNQQIARQDTISLEEIKDSTVYTRPQFEYISTRVVSNSLSSKNNWLILDRGSADGVQPDMGIVTANGVVGIVRHVSKHYCMAMSVLHSQISISGTLESSGAFGSLQWEGDSPRYLTMKDVPKHIKIKKNEPVYTSGYSLVFPKQVLIGYAGKPVEQKGSNYFTIPIKLSEDPSKFDNAFIVKNIYYTEVERLIKKSKSEQ